MKFTTSTIAAVAALTGVANAQSECLSTVTNIPACALGYVAEIAYSSFSCGIVDFACQCSNLFSIAVPLQSALATYSTACPFSNIPQAALDFCSGCTTNTGSVTLNAIESSCQPSAVAIPPCALGYLASAGVAEGCAINDFECQCSNFGAIEGDITNEVASYCMIDGVGIDTVLNSANALCACVSPTSSGGPAPVTTTPTGVTGPVTTPTTPGVTKPTTPGSSPSGNGTTPVVSSPPTSSKAPTGVMSISHFTGAGVTASAVGGLFAMVAGVVALL